MPSSHAQDLHASRPKELIHIDFLYIRLGEKESKYLLIITDDISNYIWLVPTNICDAESVAKALMDWLATFAPV